MKINQAAELVGMTSKNIRFYEDQGLIKPGRDPQNSYRDYSLEDVEQLRRIKLLRQLGVPCENIRRLGTGELDLDTCMSEQIAALSRQSGDIEHMKTICKMISDEVDDIADIKASVYLEKMEALEKGGVRFMKVESSDVKKRKTGAILAAVFVIAVIVALSGLILWANSEDPAPKGVLVFFLIIFGGIAVGVAVALKQRLAEVKKGEIDEADKY